MTLQVRSGTKFLKLCKGKVYLIPSQYASGASDSCEMGERMPAIFHSHVGDEDNLQLFVETAPLFIGLPLYHLVPMGEVRRMPPTFKNVVGTPVARRVWEERSDDLMHHMDAVLALAKENTTCPHRQCIC